MDAVSVDLDARPEVDGWRALVNWLLAIPHFVVLYFLDIVLGVLTFVAFFTVVFTARIPRGMFDVMVMIHRYQWRAGSFAAFLHDDYPPFDFTPAAEDPSTYPAQLSIAYPERFSRGLPFVKWLLAFPHYLALLFLGIGALFAFIAAFFAVLFTGRWPEGVRDYLVGVTRWGTRVGAYVGLLSDEYPPFTLAD